MASTTAVGSPADRSDGGTPGHFAADLRFELAMLCDQFSQKSEGCKTISAVNAELVSAFNSERVRLLIDLESTRMSDPLIKIRLNFLTDRENF
jgi:hypothetical protein